MTRQWSRVPDRLRPLAERMGSVAIECGDAVEVVSRWMVDPGALLYLDPPYMDATFTYGADTCHDSLLEVLAGEVKAKVAISGGEWCPWDKLGWRRTELEVAHTVGRASGTSVERLWMNYEPVGQQSLEI